MGFANLNKTHKHNLLRVLAPPPLPGRVAAAVVLLEPVVEVAEAGRVDAVAKKPAEAEPRATGRGGGGVAGRGAAAARRPRLRSSLHEPAGPPAPDRLSTLSLFTKVGGD